MADPVKGNSAVELTNGVSGVKPEQMESSATVTVSEVNLDKCQ